MSVASTQFTTNSSHTTKFSSHKAPYRQALDMSDIPKSKGTPPQSKDSGCLLNHPSTILTLRSSDSNLKAYNIIVSIFRNDSLKLQQILTSTLISNTFSQDLIEILGATMSTSCGSALSLFTLRERIGLLPEEVRQHSLWALEVLHINTELFQLVLQLVPTGTPALTQEFILDNQDPKYKMLTEAKKVSHFSEVFNIDSFFNHALQNSTARATAIQEAFTQAFINYKESLKQTPPISSDSCIQFFLRKGFDVQQGIIQTLMQKRPNDFANNELSLLKSACNHLLQDLDQAQDYLSNKLLRNIEMRKLLLLSFDITKKLFSYYRNYQAFKKPQSSLAFQLALKKTKIVLLNIQKRTKDYVYVTDDSFNEIQSLYKQLLTYKPCYISTSVCFADFIHFSSQVPAKNILVKNEPPQSDVKLIDLVISLVNLIPGVFTNNQNTSLQQSSSDSNETLPPVEEFDDLTISEASSPASESRELSLPPEFGTNLQDIDWDLPLLEIVEAVIMRYYTFDPNHPLMKSKMPLWSEEESLLFKESRGKFTEEHCELTEENTGDIHLWISFLLRMKEKEKVNTPLSLAIVVCEAKYILSVKNYMQDCNNQTDFENLESFIDTLYSNASDLENWDEILSDFYDHKQLSIDPKQHKADINNNLPKFLEVLEKLIVPEKGYFTEENMTYAC